MSLAYNHIGTYRAGSNAHTQHMRDRFNSKSLVRVDYDSSLYVYDNAPENRATAKQWREFIKLVFVDAHDPGTRRINGRFPFYEITVHG